MNRFYPFGRNESASLPKHIKAYVDGYCDEYKSIEKDEKFMHIVFVASNGTDIGQEIRAYLANHQKISDDSIKNTLASQIAYLRYGNLAGGSDCAEMVAVLSKGLTLDETITLWLIEIRFRFSFKIEGDKVIFSQTYRRWQPMKLLIKTHGAEGVKDLICHPTGYHSLSKEQLLEMNPWCDLIKNYETKLYEENLEFLAEADREIIEKFNKTADEQHKYILNVPVEPWQGNPLEAKVIILSLNPGYVDLYNKEKALQIPYPQIVEGVWKVKDATLKFSADGFIPYQNEYLSNAECEQRLKEHGQYSGVDLADAMNIIGGFYWYNRLLELNKNLGLSKYEFFRQFALIQYNPYTSASYKVFGRGQTLPTQQFTKEMLRYIAYSRSKTIFVLMRSARLWQELLDPDVWAMMQPRMIVNPNPIVQSFSEKNLGTESYNRLIEALKGSN